MGIWLSLLKGIPILYRYLSWNFLKNLIIVLLTSLLLAIFVSVLLFFNFAKIQSFKLLLEYALTSSAVYTPLFIPILELIALGLSIYTFVEKKLNWIVFSVGISPKSFIKPFFVSSLIPTLLLFFHFEFIYPKAGYLQHITYLRAKNKPIQNGIIKNFWYKNKEGVFLNFSLIHLESQRAFNGLYFAVDKNYHLRWVSYIPEATFIVKDNKIQVFARNIDFFTQKSAKKLPVLKLEFDYENKLLKVRKPSFFSTTELMDLISFAKRTGINYYPYLWELIKRFLIIVMSVLVPTIAGVYTFASIKREEFVEKISQVFLSLLAFYIALLLFQSLVLKASVNPLYGLLLIVPHTLWGIALIGKRGN